nr:imidazole glycerol phosphate synthase subunit HisH [Deinobacterium chartae]
MIDYGSGNLRSAAKALERAEFDLTVSSDPDAVARADALVIPGQGHFRQVMERFRAAGFEEPIRAAIAAGKPVLGICVGLQLLFDGSDEAPETPGLGVLRGQIRRFTGDIKVPQMQWNTLEPVGDSPLLEGVACASFAYFVHSYYAPLDAEVDAGAISDYGTPFWSVISHGNVQATQFHPEKSQDVGLQILRNFKRFAKNA